MRQNNKERVLIFKGKIPMQATNQYKQQSNFERKKLTTLMAEWLTHVSGVQIQVCPNLIHCVWD